MFVVLAVTMLTVEMLTTLMVLGVAIIIAKDVMRVSCLVHL